jgi:hypothetical protein
MVTNMRKLICPALLIAWTVYLAATATVALWIAMGDTPAFLKRYTLGTNAIWLMIGVMLWVATERFREFRDRS